MYTDQPRRLSMRQFRAAVKSDMELPVQVTSNGQVVFTVVAPDALEVLVRLPFEGHCPHCRHPIKLDW